MWLAMSCVGAVLALSWLVSSTSTDAVRYAGTMLQVLGLSTVAYGLRQMRRMFDRPTYRAVVLSWFCQLGLAPFDHLIWPHLSD